MIARAFWALMGPLLDFYYIQKGLVRALVYSDAGDPEAQPLVEGILGEVF